MDKNYGQYHDNICDLTEFIEGISDIRLEYIADTEIEIVLKSTIHNLDKVKSLLIKKSEMNIEQVIGNGVDYAFISSTNTSQKMEPEI